jgi:hypothetical protein
MPRWASRCALAAINALVADINTVSEAAPNGLPSMGSLPVLVPPPIDPELLDTLSAQGTDRGGAGR